MKAYAMGWCLAALVTGTVLAVGGGCGNDVVDFGTGGASAGTGTASTGVMTSGSNGTGGASVGGAPMTSGVSTTTGSSMTSGSSTTSGPITTGSSMSSSSTGGGACDPAPGDTACSACAKMTCCDDYNACLADANCVCWSTCLQQPNASPQACFGMCGAPSGAATTFAQCVGGGCQAQCTGGGTTGSSAASSSASSGSGSGSSSASSSAASSSAASSSAASSSAASTSASTGTGGGACPPAAGDSTCVACAKQNCCSEATACTASVKCTCWVNCLAQHPGNNVLCFQTCGVPDQATNAIGQCTQQQCQGQCP